MKYAIIGLIFLVLFAGCIQNSTSEANKTANSTTQKIYAFQEVSIHNSASDCWLTIHGKVYNVTGFIPSHPGGSAILAGCGKNATSMFEKRPNNTSHSQTARDLLKNYYIGELN